jgi:hypothetical protein
MSKSHLRCPLNVQLDTKCGTQGADVLLEFYKCAASHGIHLRTTDPIESTFATVRLPERTDEAMRQVLPVSSLGISLNKSFPPFDGSVDARRILSVTSAVTDDG